MSVHTHSHHETPGVPGASPTPDAEAAGCCASGLSLPRGHQHTEAGHPHAEAGDVHGEGDTCCASDLSLSAPSSASEGVNHNRERVRLILALLLALTAELITFRAAVSMPVTVVSMVLAAVAIALSGPMVFREGLKALFRRDLNINALMTVAVTGAFVIGEWPEAAMVMSLYALAELIEHRAVDRARHAIAGLLDLSPTVAERRNPDGTWERVPVEQIQVGTAVRVRPGERLPLDGRVTEGHSTVDQSPVTGESMPVDKNRGDIVYAGTVNLHGSLEFVATAPASDTVLARIIHAVEEAQGKKAPTQRFIDRFARIYTPAVFVLAILVALGGPLFLGGTWLDSIYRALVLLVIACPCALVISTPVTVVSALAAGARRGILIKGGVYLEEARSIGVIALDKTGTLTEGKPRLVDQHFFGPETDHEMSTRVAFALASRSDHPVSLAIARALPASDVEVGHFGAAPGHGIHGQVENGAWVLASPRKISEMGLLTADVDACLQSHINRGHTVSVLAGPQGVAALFAVADEMRSASREAIQSLHQLGVETVMLTGDNDTTARAVAAELGITQVRAGLLPQEKLDAIRAMVQSGRKTAMVGDGINDAPALAVADIGFAMGEAGTHTAMEAADVVVMNDDLRRIPETIRLSQRTHAVLWQNIVFALGIKLAFLVLAVLDQATMWMAVFADMGASLIVVGNGLRLLRIHQKN